MKIGRWLIAAAAVIMLAAAAGAQSLPDAVSGYLNASYAGWRIAPAANEYCSSEFRGTIGSGDFDGDARRDYVVKFVKGIKAYLIAFLDRRTRFAPFVLTSTPARDVRDWGMQVAAKGRMTTAGKLRNNGILVGECASEAGVFVFQNGKFKAY